MSTVENRACGDSVCRPQTLLPTDMRPDAGTARASPLIVALLVDRTDVIDEGVGQVDTRRTPPTALDTVERRGARR